MKYNAGDIIKIREDLIVNKQYGNEIFTYGMNKYKGIILTVEDVRCGFYHMKEIGYNWTEEMLEPYIETKTKVKICKDKIGEYLDLELERDEQKYNIQFYLNNVSLKSKEFVSAQKKGETIMPFPVGQEVVFDVKEWTIKDLKKKMTKEEIEAELGYKIEIVEI